MSVVLLLASVWAVVLVPPALRAHAARKHAFLVSLGPAAALAPSPPAGLRSPRIQRRRRIAGGLLVAMAATLLMGLLPTFRELLVVHLFLVDSFLAYVATLAHMANRSRGVPDLVTPGRSGGCG
jgi:MFS family permease